MAYYFQSGFFLAHLVVWASAAVLFVFQLTRVRRLAATADSVQRISEGEFRRYTYPVEKFEQYFDYCASVFIFIGLVGTMYGFIQAVPELQNSRYDFHHFRDALTVSAFGIVWSTILLGIVSLHHLLHISPLFERLLKKQTLDQLASLLGQELNRFGTQITSTLNKGLSEFSLAANSVATASTRLAETADGAAKSFTASAEALNRSAKTVNDIYQRAQNLPQTIAEQLKKIFDQQNQLLQTTFEAQVSHLKDGSVEIRETFQQDHMQWESARNTALKDARKRLAEFLEEVQRGYQKTLADEQQKLAAGAAAAVGSVRSMLEEFEASLKGVEERIPDRVQRSYADAVTQIMRATENLSSITTTSARTADSLNRSTTETQRGIESLGEALRSLALALNRLDATQISSLSRKIEDVLQTVRSKAGTERSYRPSNGRRWQPWRWFAGREGD